MELQAILDDESASRHEQKHQQRTSTHKMPVIRIPGPLRPWPWQKHRLWQDSRPEPVLEDDDPWLLEVFASLSTRSVESILEVLNRREYHGSFAQHLLQVFSQLHSNADSIQVDNAEQHLMLQEALAMWQEEKIICESPDSTDGYLVTERNVVAQSFDVAVSCSKFYEDKGVAVEPCAVTGEKYTLKGCSLSTTTCSAPKCLEEDGD
eukprot:Skav218580  [mRNA]  locus=scaffold2610:490832:492004:- [translate_table: standard]